MSYSLVGCKMWYAQNPTWCDEIMASESYLKIILERENKLAQFSSGMLARRTGVWNILPGEQVKRPVGIQLEFDEGQFDRFLQYQSDHFRIYRESAKGLVFEVTYADLMGGSFSGVQEFLGVEVLPLKPMKAKLYSRDILKRFKPEYEGTILRKLKAIQREEWIFE